MFNISYQPQSSVSTFEFLQNSVNAIREESSYNTAFGHLKKAVKEINGMTNEEGYYSVKYKKSLPQGFDSARFWEVMKDKASNPQKYLFPVVKECTITPEKSLGTINHFIRTMNSEIPESVWVNNPSKNILFFYDYQGKRRLAAINELKEGKDGKLYFIGRYVAFNLGAKSPQAFKEYMDGVFAKMVG